MRILDSRRLTGPTMYGPEPAAIAEVAFEPGESWSQCEPAWRDALASMLAAVGWSDARRFSRRFADGGGAALGFEAPPDALYAATEVNEWAIAAASQPDDPTLALGDHASRLREAIAAEHRPELLALLREAAARGVPAFFDEDGVTVGLGARSQTWPLDAVPSATAVPWSQLGAIPVVAVTGTNGKTTSARWLARMFKSAGLVAGNTSTDGIAVDGSLVETGDCTGPGAARRLLRRPELQAAVLEAARGGLLRRGFALRWCDAALLTNVSDDHLGEWGIATVDELAQAKAAIATAVRPGGRVVLGADSPPLVRLRGRFAAPQVWFSQRADHPLLLEVLAQGGEACWIEDGAIVHGRAHARAPLVAVDEIALALGGAARHNLANALGVAATALGLPIPREVVCDTLRSFGRDVHDNPGRLERYEKDGVLVLLDFAHNRDGLRQQREVVASLRRARGGRLVVSFGMAGDRSDEALMELAGEIAAMRPDHVIVREEPEYLRGREPGVVPAILRRGFEAHGIAPEAIDQADDERAAVAAALRWARSGDMVAVFAHTEREPIL
ncbi:MAG: hypothetical protein K1X88_15625 [Nannocystaceae bacterium]|nr:hypothetical protein [Nannocystaceae bacterium]